MSRNDLDIETLCPQEDPHDHGTEHHGDHHHLSPHLPRPRCECHLSTLCSTVWGGRLRKRFCNMFSESSTGSWDELQLPSCPSKQGELSDYTLQNLLLNLPPQTVYVSDLYCTGRSNWILHRIWKYSMRSFRDVVLKIERDLSNSIYNSSISRVKCSWTTLYHFDTMNMNYCY